MSIIKIDEEIAIYVFNNEQQFYIDNFGLSIIQSINNWKYDESLYYLDTNSKKKYFIELLLNISFNDYLIKFKDSNKLNLQTDNIIFSNKKSVLIPDKYKIIKEFKGHKTIMGKTANQIKNPYWIVIDKESNEKFFLMYCEVDKFTKISIDSIEKINSVKEFTKGYRTWFFMKNGYIGIHTEKSIIYLHQYLTDHFGNGKGKMSVDHINRDKLDNRLENLRIVSQSVQNENMDKKSRKHNAQKLPKELENKQFPKYVYYCKENINGSFREFFRIEKHPNLDKRCISTTKSSKVTILDKLKEAEEIIAKLNKNEQISSKKELPKYFRVYKSKRTEGKNVLEYERRVDGKRLNVKHTFCETEDIDKNLEIIKKKVKDKFGGN